MQGAADRPSVTIFSSAVNYRNMPHFCCPLFPSFLPSFLSFPHLTDEQAAAGASIRVTEADIDLISLSLPLV